MEDFQIPILKIKDKSEALVHFNFKLTQFMALVSFLYPLKTEHLYFSDIFRRYRMRPLSWNRLRKTFGINQGGGNLKLIEINCKLSTVNLGAANRISLYDNWPKCENLTSRRVLASHSNVSRSKNFASESFKSSNPSSVPLAGISFNSRYIEFCFTWDEICRKPRMSQITLARDCSSVQKYIQCQGASGEDSPLRNNSSVSSFKLNLTLISKVALCLQFMTLVNWDFKLNMVSSPLKNRGILNLKTSNHCGKRLLYIIWGRSIWAGGNNGNKKRANLSRNKLYYNITFFQKVTFTFTFQENKVFTFTSVVLKDIM